MPSTHPARRNLLALLALALPLSAAACSKTDSDASPVTAASSGNVTTTAPAGTASSTTTAGSSAADLDDTVDLAGITEKGPEDCVSIAEAHLHLFTSSGQADSDTAASVLSSFDPPPGVAKAIAFEQKAAGDFALLGSTDGLKADAQIKEWIAKLCPLTA